MRNIFAALLLLLAIPALGQNAKKIDDFVAGLMAKRGVPGLSLAVVKDGKMAYQKGYGFADLENRVPATPDTVYEIGSITKPFTAAVVLQLVQEGKMKLDSRVRDTMPELPEGWKEITVRQLLTHTSGIPSYTDSPDFWKHGRDPAGEADFLALVGGAKLDFEPGAQWKYDNSGYFLLGLLVEKVSGESLREQLRKRIFAPLGMDRSDLNDPHAIVPHRAHGYDPGPLNTTYIDMSWPYAAGAMISTVEDLAKWDAALYGDKILPAETWKEAWTPATLANGNKTHYGFGWALGKLGDEPTIGHDGAINGFNASLLRIPSKKLTIIACCNADPGIAEAVARGVAGIVDPSLVDVVKPIPDPEPKIGEAHKAILQALIDGNLKKDLFTEEMQARLFPAFVDQVHDLLSRLGSIESFSLVRLEDKDGLQIRSYRASIGGQGVTMSVVTNKEGKISGFSINLT
ncbi:MAG TPA: serine hydrolase [Fimbriimonadaceae bacterium]|nr:serine hydrolase [Fimbriimonadaceae bacterium]